jgi:hypothetical protein
LPGSATVSKRAVPPRYSTRTPEKSPRTLSLEASRFIFECGCVRQSAYFSSWHSLHFSGPK